MAGTTYTVLLYAVLSSLAQGDQNCQGEDCPATVNSLLQFGKKAIQIHTSSAAVQATTADATQDTYTCRSDRDFINPSSTVSYNQVRQCGSVGCSSGYTTDQKMALLQECKDRCTAQSNCVAIAVQYVEMCLLYTGSPTDSDVRGWTHGAQDNNAVCFKENSPWKTAVAISGDGTTTATDIGSTAFNALFAACPVVQYTRNSQVHSVYKRTSPIPDGFDAYSVFTDTWVSTDNTRGTDFNLYSSFDDASADSGAWAFCNYDDPDVAYPRDCGKSGAVGNQWFSMPGGRFNARGVASGASFEVYQGSDCPVQLSDVREANCLAYPYQNGFYRNRFYEGCGYVGSLGGWQQCQDKCNECGESACRAACRNGCDYMKCESDSWKNKGCAMTNPQCVDNGGWATPDCTEGASAAALAQMDQTDQAEAASNSPFGPACLNNHGKETIQLPSDTTVFGAGFDFAGHVKNANSATNQWFANVTLSKCKEACAKMPKCNSLIVYGDPSSNYEDSAEMMQCFFKEDDSPCHDQSKWTSWLRTFQRTR